MADSPQQPPGVPRPRGRGKGRPFAKGNSANPGGRPRVVHDVRALAQSHVPAAIATLQEIAADRDAHPGARVAAAKELLDRAVGRAPAAPEDAGLVKDALEVIVRTITDGP